MQWILAKVAAVTVVVVAAAFAGAPRRESGPIRIGRVLVLAMAKGRPCQQAGRALEMGCRASARAAFERATHGCKRRGLARHYHRKREREKRAARSGTGRQRAAYAGRRGRGRQQRRWRELRVAGRQYHGHRPAAPGERGRRKQGGRRGGDRLHRIAACQVALGREHGRWRAVKGRGCGLKAAGGREFV
ncbi:hypothetical protein BC828DRAFT_392025, partial [Blastocladiella britannica]